MKDEEHPMVIGIRGIVEVGTAHLSEEERKRWSDDSEPNLLKGRDGEQHLRQMIESFLEELTEERSRRQLRPAIPRAREIEAAGRALVGAGALSEERFEVILGAMYKVLRERGNYQAFEIGEPPD